jgi:predicted RNA-binding protein (virulence factor B family)
MKIADALGRRISLRVTRLAQSESTLGDGSAEVPVPTRELPEGVHVGDRVEVWPYLGRDDRLAATTRRPLAARDEVAFLRVSGVTSFGAFVAWGPPKDLLLPASELTRELRVGERVPLGVVLDDTARLSATMRIRELLRADGGLGGSSGAGVARDEWLAGEAWRVEPGIGLFVILERTLLGLVPEEEPHALRPGDAARFRVARVHPDGKLELSLRGHGIDELATDAERLLAALSKPGAPRVGDASSPEEIRARFGISKKAFKRAIGNLLKRGAVTIDGEGFVVVARR